MKDLAGKKVGVFYQEDAYGKVGLAVVVGNADGARTTPQRNCFKPSPLVRGYCAPVRG